jgi:hypothetical protein
MTKVDFTKEDLLKDGWQEPTDKDPSILMFKNIPNTNPINDTPEDTDIKLVIHRMYNSQNFAVQFPDGGLLNFVANSIEDLKKFESMIAFYDCPY